MYQPDPNKHPSLRYGCFFGPVIQALCITKELNMHNHEKIDYVEFPATNMSATKKFFESVFSWEFEDYGPEYTAFVNQGLDGGFYKSELNVSAERGSALIVFYSNNLEGTLQKVVDSGGTIVKSIFSFPGGRRFHFTDPSVNEFAVWSEINA